MIHRNGRVLPIIYPISPSLFLDTKEFEQEVYLSGFPILDDRSSLDKETEEFLKNGSKPIIVTFSSMPLKDPNAFLEKIEAALLKSKNRGILITGNSGIDRTSSNNILIKEFLPHDIVFGRAKGILHHGGVGTMAAALRSGIPQVLMPFNVDQPFWAKRIFDLGYSLRPLMESDSIDEFASRFTEMDRKDAILQAERIAKVVKLENANSNAVRYIEQLYAEWVTLNE